MFGPRLRRFRSQALPTPVAEGFPEEPFRQMRYLDPVPINDWGNEELGLLGIRPGNPAPSSKAAEVRAQKVLPGTKRMVVLARKEWTPSSFGDSGHGEKESISLCGSRWEALIPRPFEAGLPTNFLSS